MSSSDSAIEAGDNIEQLKDDFLLEDDEEKEYDNDLVDAIKDYVFETLRESYGFSFDSIKEVSFIMVFKMKKKKKKKNMIDDDADDTERSWMWRKKIRDYTNKNKTKNEYFHSILKGLKYNYRSSHSSPTTQIEDYVEVTENIMTYAGFNYMHAIRNSIMFVRLCTELIGPKSLQDDITNNDGSYTSKLFIKCKREIHEQELIKFEFELVEMYAIIYGQCTYAMKKKLKSSGGDTFKKIDTECDTIGLLKMIKGILYSYKSIHPNNRSKAILKATNILLNIKQTSCMSNIDYFQKFKKYVQVLKVCGGCGDDFTGNFNSSNLLDDVTTSIYGPTITKYEDLPKDNPQINENEDNSKYDDEYDYDYSNDNRQQPQKHQQRKILKKVASEFYLTKIFIENADQERHAKLQCEFHNSQLFGYRKTGPKTLYRAYMCLEHHS